MFERFTERARQVTVLSQDEARALKHNYIGTEHLLIALLREGEGLAHQALTAVGVQENAVREQVRRIVGAGDVVTDGQIPFTPRAKKVLEGALREALSAGHNYIGTEHILLGLARESAGVAARILLDLDVDSERIRGEVWRLLQGRRAKERESATVVVPGTVELRLDSRAIAQAVTNCTLRRATHGPSFLTGGVVSTSPKHRLLGTSHTVAEPENATPSRTSVKTDDEVSKIISRAAKKAAKRIGLQPGESVNVTVHRKIESTGEQASP